MLNALAARLSRLFPSIANPQRNPLIDALRGFSILLVVGSHYSLLDHRIGSPEGTVLGRTFGSINLGMGYYGVVFFFVISGFLITKVTLDRYGRLSNIDCSAFWWMRFSRIMPLVLCCLACMILFHLFGFAHFHYTAPQALEKSVFGVLSFRYNAEIGNDPLVGAWNPLWSLSIEEMFYLVFPMACLALNGFGSLVWLGLAVMASALYFRIQGSVGVYSTAACMDLLALGVLTANLRIDRLATRWTAFKRKALGYGLLAAGLGVSLACVIRSHPFENGAFVYVPLLCGFGAALALLATQLLRINRLSRTLLFPLSTLGVVSYELYLVHLPLSAMLAPVLDRASWWTITLGIVLSVSIHEGFSEPLNRRLRLYSRKAPAKTGKPSPSPGSGLLHPLVLAVCCISVFVLVGKFLHEPRKGLVRFAEIEQLVPGTVEPIAYTGRTGAGDLVYLKHEQQNLFRIGVDHWGTGAVESALLGKEDLVDLKLNLKLSAEGIDVWTESKKILSTQIRPYSVHEALRYGVNDIGFSRAIPVMRSKLTFRAD